MSAVLVNVKAYVYIYLIQDKVYVLRAAPIATLD